MSDALARLPDARKRELVEAWRDRAGMLDRYAARRRQEGDPAEALDAEQASLDYRIAADELEAQLPVGLGDPAGYGGELSEGGA